MDIVKTISGLIEDVYNGDIDSLDELQRELIHLRSKLEQLTLTDVVKSFVCDCEKCKPFINFASGFRKNKECIEDKAN